MESPDVRQRHAVRVATFNVSLFRGQAGGLITDMEAGESAQAKKIAAVIQLIRPDIILLNEFDYDAEGRALAAFQAQFLAIAQGDQAPLVYEHGWVFPSNTGVHSGFDLNNDGAVTSAPGGGAYGGDAFGYGVFEGQYGFAVLSRFPLSETAPRGFQNFLWKDMPNNLIPSEWYSPEEIEVFRLSSKNHVDVTIDVLGADLHLLASHPTPPGFDGDEDRNGRRNHDEVRFWADYLDGQGYFIDDDGQLGAMPSDAHFVILGDLNLDPFDGDSRPEGGREAASSQGLANTQHEGDSAFDTADFSDGVVGNLRVDYALASGSLDPVATGVFWPTLAEDPQGLAAASDHHMVWVDVQL